MDEMGKQVKELREYAEYLDWVGAEKVMKALITQAADSIEALSAKLTAANMERSDRHYGEEKKLIEELAEEIKNCYGRETELSERARDYLLKTDYGGGWIACEDRNHMPEEHEEFRDVFDPDTLAVVDTEHYTASDLVQVTVYDIDKDEYFVCDDCTVDGKWSNFGLDGFKVTAWQPLPEPYRP